MNLVNMQNTPAEAEEEATEVNQPAKYPWGLAICVEDDVMQKLGLKEVPAVGSVVMLTARCEVCSASAYQRQGGDAEASFSLQITDMALDMPKVSLSDRLYAKKG
jgi:hypothetical protein